MSNDPHARRTVLVMTANVELPVARPNPIGVTIPLPAGDSIIGDGQVWNKRTCPC